MPIVWKILSKKFLLNILFFTLFFLSVTLFFKLSRLTKYFLSGSDLNELFLMMGLFLHKCFPIALAITSFISSFLVVLSIKKSHQITAFKALGLNPRALFTPLIFLSIFLSIGNFAISFILYPSIKAKLELLIEDKKEKTPLIKTFSRRFSRDNLYVSMDLKEESDKAFNLFLLNTDHEFSWLIADAVIETKEGLDFTNLTYCKITPETYFDTLFLSQGKKAFASKKTIYSFFPYSMVRFEEKNPSFWEFTLFILHLCYPIVFTSLGICFALKKHPKLSLLVFLYALLAFSFSLKIHSSITGYLMIGSFLMTFLLTFKEIKACAKEGS
jgi:lipopolysaccharide export LptBFGC system permease protein LptF